MTGLAACTIVSKNYLPFARVLARSFLRHHPEGRFHVLLADRVEGRFDPAAEPFELVTVEELGNIPDLRSFLFKYTILELNTAVKPYFLEHLLARGVERLLYLDPDILVLQPMDELERSLRTDSIVLTPHLTEPIEDGLLPDELTILRAGTYNLGFLGLRDGAEVRAFLSWWQDRLHDRCVVRQEEGLFVDQKWIDLVPGLWDGVRILRHPGYNVAYWNLHGRTVVLDDPPRVNGEPLFFYHFSGIQPEALEAVSFHQTRFRLGGLGDVATLFRRYREMLLAQGLEQTRSWPYAFGTFDDGTPIPDVARELYRSLGAERRRFGDPFATAGRSSFLAWLNAPAVGGRRGRLTRLLLHLHQRDPELRAAFPDPCGRDEARLVEWLELNARRQLGLCESFWRPVAPVLTSGRGPSLLRWLRRELKRAYDAPSARRLKDRLKTVLGGGIVSRLKRLKGRLLGDRSVSDRPAPPSVPPPRIDRLGVAVLGYLTTESGMGEAGRSVVWALEAAGVQTVRRDLAVNVRSRRDDRRVDLGGEDSDVGINLVVVNADQVGEVAHHLGASRFAGRYNVGCWSWEQDSFPHRWLAAFERFDEIWTPSRFGVEAITSVSPIPVRRLPHVVEATARPGVERALFGLPEGPFVFLFVFDYLSFVERKNPLGLVRAFRSAFGSSDEVLLVLKTVNAERCPEARAELERAARGAPVRFLDGYLERQEVYDLMAVSDAYASLHRSEGFGLTLAEAMCLGKPVIATGYSGNTDFMTVNNSLLVRYQLATLEEAVGPYEAGTRWAEPDEGHAAEVLRRVVEHPEKARALGERARQDVASELSRRAVGELVRRRLLDILRRHPPAAWDQSPIATGR